MIMVLLFFDLNLRETRFFTLKKINIKYFDFTPIEKNKHFLVIQILLTILHCKFLKTKSYRIFSEKVY